MRVPRKQSGKFPAPCRWPASGPLQAEHLRKIRTACSWMEHSEQPPSLRELAAAVNLSPFYFHRLFRRYVGITPKEYLAASQRERLVRALIRGMPVLQAIYDAGYSSTSRVYGRLEHLLGMTPAQVRMGASGVSIRYVLTPCHGGWVLAATAHRGLCALELGGNPSELLGLLAARFPRATLVDGGSAMAVAVACLTSSLSPAACDVALPRDILAVALQRRLWNVLQRARIGSVDTYVDVARTLGHLRRSGQVRYADLRGFSLRV